MKRLGKSSSAIHGHNRNVAQTLAITLLNNVWLLITVNLEEVTRDQKNGVELCDSS